MSVRTALLNDFIPFFFFFLDCICGVRSFILREFPRRTVDRTGVKRRRKIINIIVIAAAIDKRGYRNWDGVKLKLIYLMIFFF